MEYFYIFFYMSETVPGDCFFGKVDFDRLTTTKKARSVSASGVFLVYPTSRWNQGAPNLSTSKIDHYQPLSKCSPTKVNQP